MISFNVENWTDFWKEGQVLAALAYVEVGEGLSFSPDVSGYENLYEGGHLVILTAREDGNMIGYLLMVVRKHFHSTGIKAGTEEAMYLKPEKRIGTTGIRMMKIMEVVLKSLGVQRVYYTSRPQRDLSRLYSRLGFSPVASIFAKNLE